MAVGVKELVGQKANSRQASEKREGSKKVLVYCLARVIYVQPSKS